MMLVRQLFYFFIFLGYLSSCAHPLYNREKTPTLASINLVNQDGMSEIISNPERLKQYEEVNFLANQPYQKILRVYQRDREGHIAACVTSYHTNGQIKQYLDVSNGRACGTYTEWYPNGTIKIRATIIGGDADITIAAKQTWLFDGCSQAWNENGGLQATILYEKGLLQGKSLYYHANGTIWKKIPFNKNQIEGLYQVYQEEGPLLLSANYHNGQQEGCAMRYWDAEHVAAEEHFKQDKLLQGTYYNFNGEVISSIKEGYGYRALFNKTHLAELQEYRQGILEGEVKVFCANQNLKIIYHVKDSLKHGEEIEYYDHPSSSSNRCPKLSLTWFNGKIQGLVRTWYDNGRQESQREMSNNVKNGVATAWYQDGNLMLIEEYDHGKLIKGEYFKKGEKSTLSQVKAGKGVATLFDAEGHFLRKIDYLNGLPVD